LSRTELKPSLSRPFLTPRHYTWLVLGFSALVVYGSLVPFHFEAVPWGDAVARFRVACSQPVRVESRSDWAANSLSFIPLSFLWMAALAVDRRWYAGSLAALVVLPGCTLLSAAVEFTQLYFPPRVTSVNDIVAESLGGFLGIILWLIGGQGITRWLRHCWKPLDNNGSVARLLPGVRPWATLSCGAMGIRLSRFLLAALPALLLWLVSWTALGVLVGLPVRPPDRTTRLQNFIGLRRKVG